MNKEILLSNIDKVHTIVKWVLIESRRILN